MENEFKIGDEVIYMIKGELCKIVADKITPHVNSLGEKFFPDKEDDFLIASIDPLNKEVVKSFFSVAKGLLEHSPSH